MRAAAFALALLAAPAMAGEVVVYEADVSYDDALFGLENAIVNRGYVVDQTNQVAEMLERTKADVGATRTVFTHGVTMAFCSATLSRRMMEIDPLTLAYCPYTLFVSETPDGVVRVGYRSMPDGPMKEVEALLDEIAREAVEGF